MLFMIVKEVPSVASDQSSVGGSVPIFMLRVSLREISAASGALFPEPQEIKSRTQKTGKRILSVFIKKQP